MKQSMFLFFVLLLVIVVLDTITIKPISGNIIGSFGILGSNS
jgi:hypothetical protein